MFLLLVGKKEIKRFIEENELDILKNSEENHVMLIKMKVFNERKKNQLQDAANKTIKKMAL